MSARSRVSDLSTRELCEIALELRKGRRLPMMSYIRGSLGCSLAEARATVEDMEREAS